MISIHLAKCFQLKTEQKFTAELLPAPSFCTNYISPGWERVQILPLPKRIQRVSSLLPNLSAPVGDIQHNTELGWSLRHGASFPHHGWLSRETRQDSCIWWPSSKVSILQEEKKSFSLLTGIALTTGLYTKWPGTPVFCCQENYNFRWKRNILSWFHLTLPNPS